MIFGDLVKLYEEKKTKYGKDAYRHVSELFQEAKSRHREEYLGRPATKKKQAQGKEVDPDQAWRAFKGKNFEKLILHILSDEISSLGLKCTTDKSLDKKRLSEELSKVRRNLVVHYGKYDVLPDTDIIIYDPKMSEIIGVISCKITLRERIAQTAYWKLKLAADPVTEQIKVFFVTTDEDGHLVKSLENAAAPKGFKNRIIVEHEFDGTYVLRRIEESENVKMFDKFIEDLRKLLRR